VKPILIVGQGLAGTILALNLRKLDLPFLIVDDGHRTSSSLVAAGLYNPLILKRGRLTWRALDFFHTCEAFFRQCEMDFGTSFLHSDGLHRRIHDTEEYNNWAALRGLPEVGSFVDGYVSAKRFPATFDLPFDTCKVKGGWLDVAAFLEAALDSFIAKEEFQKAEFAPEDVVQKEGEWSWKERTFSRIVLCTGYKSMDDKTFFPDLPFTPAKGHTMDIHWPGVALDKVIQASVFVLPLGDDTYRVGSTYSWSDFNEEVEQNEIYKLKTQLTELCDLSYTVLTERAGVRPAVKDRRPLIGESKEHKGVWHFGGFGSRAVLTCPTLSKEFIEAFMGRAVLNAEVSLDSRCP